MNLIENLQHDIIDPKIQLTDILRKSLIFAHKLKSNEFKKWIENELNGYPSDIELLPEYRKIQTQTFGNFVGPFGRSLQNAPIPTAHLPKKIHEYATNQYFFESIKELESLASNNEDTIRSSWPPDFSVAISEEIYQDMVCLQAWKVISVDKIEGIINNIRNRLLKFILEIEDLSEKSEKIEIGIQKIPKEDVTQTFNTYILGNNNIITSVNNNQILINDIITGDLSSLINSLEDFGLDRLDLKDLQSAIEKDGKREKKEGIGNNVSTWLGKMINKAATGVWKVAVNVATDMLTKALISYYGW